MKGLRDIILLLLVFITLLISPAFTQTTNILFIGNSITASGVPDVVSELAMASGDSVYTELLWNGQLLRDYTSDPSVLDGVKSKLKERRWDYVVLQENSQVSGFYPGWTQGYFEYYSYQAAKTLNELIRANNSCTETVFFMTYGYINGDQSNFPDDNYFKHQSRIKRNYLLLADSFSSAVTPVGVAWENIMLNSGFGSQLYLPNDHHPSELGVYLAGCVFYATLLKKSPKGLDFYSSLNPAKAAFLQALADTIVFHDSNDWNININKPSAVFNPVYLDDKIQFTNLSKSKYLADTWYFGDSSESHAHSPIHIFDTLGKYYLVQHIQSGNCYYADTFSQHILYCPPAVSSFDFSIQADRFVSFTNHSKKSGHYLWRFGDGNTDTAANPVHQFDSNKFYIVCLFASNSCSTDTFCVPIEVIPQGVKTGSKADNIFIYPNPGQGVFTFNSGKQSLPIEFRIYNNYGKRVNVSVNNQRIDISTLPSGFYWIRVVTASRSYFLKYVKL